MSYVISKKTEDWYAQNGEPLQNFITNNLIGAGWKWEKDDPASGAMVKGNQRIAVGNISIAGNEGAVDIYELLPYFQYTFSEDMYKKKVRYETFERQSDGSYKHASVVTIEIDPNLWNDYAEYVIANSSLFSKEDVKRASEYITGTKTASKEDQDKDKARIIEGAEGKSNETILKENLKKCLDSMTAIMSKDAHYAPFVVFKLIGYDIKDGKQVKTTEFIIDGRNNSYNVSSYFQYKRNGTGQANRLTIALVFSPHERAKSLLDIQNQINPNMLEVVLTQLCIASKNDKNKDISDEEYDKLVQSTLWSCRLQVGYSVDGGEDIVSPEYDTMVVDYHSEFTNNQLVYSIDCVSSILQTKTVAKSKQPALACTQEPVEAFITFLLDSLDEEKFYFCSGDLPNEKPIFTKLKEGGVSKYDPKAVVECNVTKNFRDTALYRMEVEGDTSEATSKIVEEGIPKGTEEDTILRIAQNILSYATLRDEYLSQWKGQFKFSISDNVDIAKNLKSKSLIYLHFENELEDFSAQENINSTYSFQWLDTPTPESLVQNFKIDASGAHIKAAINTSTKNLFEDLYVVSNEGEVIRLSDTDSLVNESGEYAPWYRIVREYVYKEALMKLGNYTATLTLPGVPAEIPILTTFKIDVYMNGVKHFSSGYYRVTATEDTLDTSGYLTNLTLLKITENIDVDELANRLKHLISSFFKNFDFGVYKKGSFELNGDIKTPAQYAKAISRSKNTNLYNYWNWQYKTYKQNYRGKKSKMQSFEDYVKEHSKNVAVPLKDTDVELVRGGSYLNNSTTKLGEKKKSSNKKK